VFSGDTAVNDNLIALAHDADIMVHQVIDLAYFRRHGAGPAELERMAASLTDVTQVGNVAERARVGELILTHYLPAEPDAISDAEWAERAGHGYRGTATAGTDGLRRVLPLPDARGRAFRHGGGTPRLARSTRQRRGPLTWDQWSGSYLKESWSLVR
jgi:hypothetical protein